MPTVLFIEDDADIRANVEELLSLARYNVITASDGKEGIEMAINNLPDLIISDVMMPVIDGFGVLHILQATESTRNIPFIFLTAKNLITDLRLAMNLGANDYIIKPFEGSDLLHAVNSLLTKTGERIKGNTASEPGKDDETDSKNVLAGLIERCETMHYKKGQVIFKEGSTPRFLYFIKTGKARTYKSHLDGKDLVTGLYGEKDYLGHASILEHIFYNETAEIIEDAELVLIPVKEFEKMIDTHPEVQKKFIQMLAKSLVEKQEQIIGLAYDTLRKKVASALVTIEKKYGAGTAEKYRIDMNRDELASIAGTATESLIRTLTEFKHERLIDINNGTITITNQGQLAKLIR